MGVEEPNLADPAVYSGESFSQWVITSNRALSTSERAPARHKQSRCTRRKDFCAICLRSGRSQCSRVWCECDHSRGQSRYFLSSCQRPGTQRLPFTHSQLWSTVSGFAKSAFYPHTARPHLRRVRSSGRPRGHTHTRQILSV